MTGKSPPLSNASLFCFQHIFDKYAITSRRIIYQHMGDRAYQIPVLNNGTATHE